MEIPGPCSECHRTRILGTCHVCGALVCGECLQGRHDCAMLGRRLLGGALGDEDLTR